MKKHNRLFASFILCLPILLCWGFVQRVNAQLPSLSTDTLPRNTFKLTEINVKYGHTYVFDLEILYDSIFWLMPNNLPPGYYEAYYEQDTNQLALNYYSYGMSNYAQQYYKSGAMKSDSEYNQIGQRHGVHVLYNRAGEEIWYAIYDKGELEYKYTFAYAKKRNRTKQATKAGKLVGRYQFTPTPSRARKDYIELQEGGTFLYAYSTQDCDYCEKAKGKWEVIDNYLRFELEENKEAWIYPQREMILVGQGKLRNLQLVDRKPWGLDWYHSEYSKD